MATQARWPPHHKNASNPQQLATTQPNMAKSSNEEGRIILAKKLVKSGHSQSIRAAAESYDCERVLLVLCSTDDLICVLKPQEIGKGAF
jgi:hypothetical protein